MVKFTFEEPAAWATSVFVCVYACINTILLVCSIILLIKRRQHRIIKYRNIVTLIPYLVYFYYLSIVQTVSIIMGKPKFCTIISVSMSFMYYFISHFLLTTPTIVFQSEINNVKLTGNISTMTNIASKFIKLPVRLIVTFIIGSVHLCLFMLLTHYFTFPQDNVSSVSSAGADECNRIAIMTSSIVSCVFAVILTWFTYKLLFIKDPFFMRLELITTVVATTPVTLIMGITYMSAPYLFEPWFDYRWVFALMSLFMTVINGLFPVLLTYDSYFNWLTALTTKNSMLTTDEMLVVDVKTNKLTDKLNLTVIEAIFENEALKAGFKQFASAQWSVENVLFYESVDNYRTGYDLILDAVTDADNIYNTFIKPGCVSEINIDDNVKNNITHIINKGSNAITSTMFDEAQSHIMILMRDDTLVKWQKTKEFKLLIESVVSKSANSSGSKTNLTIDVNYGNSSGSSLPRLLYMENVV